MVVLLSVVAGCVDAVSYLGLGRVFTANMTGNTVLLGLSLGQADWQAALRSGVALAGFIMGVAVGTVIAGRDREEHAVWPITVTLTLAIELAILAAFALGLYLAGGAAQTLILLAALAMGLQSTAVRRLGIPGVATTYITGTLTGVIEGAIGRLYLGIFSAATSDERGERGSRRATTSARGLVLPADVWFAYAIGAVAAGALEFRWPTGGLLPSVAVVALVVVISAVGFRRRGGGHGRGPGEET
ncbi:MAG TPA: YoaK family protein [Rubrobacter sp.]|nr:YoaK family protein [Rubrobacter sp.]